MANVSFNTYDYYNGGWVGGQNWGSGYFYVGAEGRSDNINNLVSINVSGASVSSPVTSITVSVAVCITNNDNGVSTRITGYLYDTYTASLKGSTAAVPSGYINYGTSSAITATSSGTLATFTISGLNITSNGYIYLKLYSSSSYLKQIYTGSGSISCTTGSSSGDDSGGGTATYYYRAYDITTNTYLTSSASTTSSSILRPTVSSAYTYLGFVTHSSYDQCIAYYNSSGLEGTSTSCAIHNSTYPYIVFFYASQSSTSTTYYYRAYDAATGSYLTNTASTTSSSISKPSVSSSYTYIGYVTHTSFDACINLYNRSGVEGSTSSCSAHNSTYPYVLFIYTSSSGGGGVVQEYSITDKGAWSTTLASQGGVSIGNYQVFRYSYTPTASGTLTFYSTTPSVDTVGWIHSSASCSIDADGQPLNGNHYIGTYTDDDDGYAFSATSDLSANTTYYLFVCCHGGGSGTVTLNVHFTRKGYTIFDAGVWNTSLSSKSLNIDSCIAYRYSYTPSTNGTLTFYADNTNVDTIGWISTDNNCSIEGYGRPLSSSYYIGTYTDDANGNAFSATADLTAGTTYYLYVDCYNGDTGSVNLFIDFTSPRPNNWTWINTISSGSQIKLTAAEWNSFTSRINEFRTYAGLSTYNFTTAISGTTPIEYTICNQAHTAINAITGHGAMPTQLTDGGPLYASFFNGLKDALNAIP